MSPPSELPTDNVVTSRSGSEEPSHEREEGEEAPPRLEEVLCNLGLDSLIATFTREQMDFDSFVSQCTYNGLFLAKNGAITKRYMYI